MCTKDKEEDMKTFLTKPTLLSLGGDGTRREIIDAMVQNFTAPALASALRDREDLLLHCAALVNDPENYEELRRMLSPFAQKAPPLSTLGVKPDRDQILPQELDDNQIALFKKRLSRLPREVSSAFTAKRASVVVPLCNDAEGRPAVLFTQRSMELRSHRGEVCFPGGMVDDNDDSVIDTALRELQEEIGIPRAQVQVLGILRCDWGEIQSITGVAVTPIVGFLGNVDLNQLKYDSGEVEQFFAVPFEDIAKRSNWELRDHSAPVFKGGPQVIWGLTAYVLERFLNRVLYHHRGNERTDPRSWNAYAAKSN